MAKAFSEEEKRMIKEKIMETALELFHDRGTKSLSIGALTKRVGIAQGSFYSFWADKEALIIDVMAYRSRQKLEAIEREFSSSLAGPAAFLSEVIYSYAVDLLVKIKTQPTYREAFAIFARKDRETENRFEKLYGDFLKKLIQYWRQHGAVQRADEAGLAGVFVGSFVLCSAYYQFDEKYFDELLKTFITGVVGKYIEL